MLNKYQLDPLIHVVRCALLLICDEVPKLMFKILIDAHLEPQTRFILKASWINISQKVRLKTQVHPDKALRYLCGLRSMVTERRTDIRRDSRDVRTDGPAQVWRCGETSKDLRFWQRHAGPFAQLQSYFQWDEEEVPHAMRLGYEQDSSWETPTCCCCRCQCCCRRCSRCRCLSIAPTPFVVTWTGCRWRISVAIYTFCAEKNCGSVSEWSSLPTPDDGTAS